jgi:hypothetical protein
VVCLLRLAHFWRALSLPSGAFRPQVGSPRPCLVGSAETHGYTPDFIVRLCLETEMALSRSALSPAPPTCAYSALRGSHREELLGRLHRSWASRRCPGNDAPHWSSPSSAATTTRRQRERLAPPRLAPSLRADHDLLALTEQAVLTLVAASSLLGRANPPDHQKYWSWVRLPVDFGAHTLTHSRTRPTPTRPR